jgi:enoyl-CoA hydratase/carnithine racemase
MNPQIHVSRPADGVAQLLLDNGPGNFATAPLHERLEAALEWVGWMAEREPGDLAMDKALILGARDLPFTKALKRETGLFVSRFADERTVSRLREVQRRYDEGADSYDAFGLPRT